MTVREPLTIAVEKQNSQIIEEAQKAVADYVRANKTSEDIQIVAATAIPPSECSEIEGVIQESLRRAEIVRLEQSSMIGFSFAYGFVSARAKDPRKRLYFPTLFVATSAREGLLGLGFPEDTCPGEVYRRFKTDVEHVEERLRSAMIEEPTVRIAQVGDFLAKTMAGRFYAEEKIVSHWVH